MGGLAAVELGGTRCRAATGTACGIVERFEIQTGDPQSTLVALAEWLHELGSFRAMGIASFGPLRLDSGATTFGQVLVESKSGWNGVDVMSPFQHLADKFVLETDVGAAALGEQFQLGGRGTLAYVTVGTGIGGGLVVDGRVHHGQLHPEMGHLRVVHDGSFAGVCTTHGDCWEGLASGPALATRTGAPAEMLPASHPAWVTEAELLAQGLLAISAIAMPDTIVLGGGVMQHASLREEVAQRLADLMAGFTPLPDVIAPTLGNDSALSGALELAERALGDSLPHSRTQSR